MQASKPITQFNGCRFHIRFLVRISSGTSYGVTVALGGRQSGMHQIAAWITSPLPSSPDDLENPLVPAQREHRAVVLQIGLTAATPQWTASVVRPLSATLGSFLHFCSFKSARTTAAPSPDAAPVTIATLFPTDIFMVISTSGRRGLFRPQSSEQDRFSEWLRAVRSSG